MSRGRETLSSGSFFSNSDRGRVSREQSEFSYEERNGTHNFEERGSSNAMNMKSSPYSQRNSSKRENSYNQHEAGSKYFGEDNRNYNREEMSPERRSGGHLKKFGGSYNQENSGRGNEFDDPSNSVAKDFERKNNIREPYTQSFSSRDHISGINRESSFAMWKKPDHSNVENDRLNQRNSYDHHNSYPSNREANLADRYNSSSQDDGFSSKHRGPSARGSFAGGHSGHRNENDYNRGSADSYGRNGHLRFNESQSHNYGNESSFNKNFSESDDKTSRPTRGGYRSGRQGNENTNDRSNADFDSDRTEGYAESNYSNRRGGYVNSRGSDTFRNGYENSNRSYGSYGNDQRNYRNNFGNRDENDTGSYRNNDYENRRGYDNERSNDRNNYGGGRNYSNIRNIYDNGSNSFNNDRESTRGSYRGGRGGGGSSYENGSNSFNNDRESTRGSYRGGRSGGNFYDNASDNFNNDRESTRGSYRGGRGRVGNFYDNGSDNFNNDRESTRGSFRGGRGGDRFSRRFDSDNNFEDRDHSRNNPFSDVPAIDPASRAPRGWVPEKHDVEKYFEEDRNKEKYSEFDMDEKFKTTGGKDIQYKTWDETGLHEKLLADLTEKCHFKKVRPIQGRVIPHVLAKCNLLGHSQTGSGKTLAYVLPILHHLLTSEGFGENIFYNPKVLVIVPTRELAVQVYNEFRKFASGTNINIGVAFGQYSRKENLADIANVHVIIGTVGRIKDFTSSSNLDVRNLSHIVLDEADKILKESDRAFQEMIHDSKFRSVIPKCQVLMFTATLPTAFDKLTTDLLGSDYVTITNEERMKANNHVEQIYVHTATKKEKHDELKKIIENHSDVKILIFVKTKDMADILSGTFEQQGLKIESLHGGRPQNLRDQIFNNFKAGGTQIVIGTDVCGRGWDIDGLDIVVNFDMPSSMESMDDCMDTFIHRIGRTGRMKNGKAITFISDEDKDFVPHLIKLCQASQQEVPEFMLEIEKSNSGSSTFGRTFTDRSFFTAGETSFGSTVANVQGNTNSWDLTTKSANDIDMSAAAASSSFTPNTGDPWACSNGWGENTQNDEPTITNEDSKINENGRSDLHSLHDRQLSDGQPKSVELVIPRIDTSHNVEENSFEAFDEWDTSGAVWGTGAEDNKPTDQSDDEDEKLLPSNTNDNGGGEY